MLTAEDTWIYLDSGPSISRKAPRCPEHARGSQKQVGQLYRGALALSMGSVSTIRTACAIERISLNYLQVS
jgi:hypothetical protein